MAPWRRRAREFFTVLLVVGLIIAAPTVYAMNWPPAVIVESSSMMHPDSEVSYGRVGTIDPGDLVLVKIITSPEEVRTFVEGDVERYGAEGDVIVYYPASNRERTPIIHRAMAYVDVVDADGARSYRVRWNPEKPCEGNGEKDPTDAAWCVHPPEGILIPSARIQWGREPYRPNADGFITKGDNPSTNPAIDPAGISHDAEGRPSVVRLEWLEGKARGELPWLGLMKLALAGKPNEAHPPASYVKVGSAYAPSDLWVSLAISLTVVLGGPLTWDAWKAWRAKRPQA